MHIVAETNMLVRTQIELPAGLKLATDEFREGWSFIRSDAGRLEKKMRSHGWNFIKIDNGYLRSGVGETSQKAIASALRLALGQISEHFNAVEVQRVNVTQYPWFFLARVTVSSYRIQQGAELTVPCEALSLPITLPSTRLPHPSDVLDPGFASAMPMLKQMLVSSKGLENASL